MMKMGFSGRHYLAEMETDAALSPLQSAACTYRIALGSRAGQKVLTLKTISAQNTQPQENKNKECGFCQEPVNTIAQQ